jgi:hypothetical protein
LENSREWVGVGLILKPFHREILCFKIEGGVIWNTYVGRIIAKKI